MKPPVAKSRLSRRQMLQRAAAAGVAGAVPTHLLGQPVPAGEPYRNLGAAAAQTLEAVVARLIPSDGNGPGALEAGAASYIDRALGDALAAFRGAYAAGLAALDAEARRSASVPFADLGAARQDALLTDFEQGRVATFPAASTFFDVLLNHTLEGTFGDPYYGGNRDFVGWDLVGYPGLRLAVTADEQRMSAQVEPTRVSAYELPMFEPGPREAGDDRDR